MREERIHLWLKVRQEGSKSPLISRKATWRGTASRTREVESTWVVKLFILKKDYIRTIFGVWLV